MAITSAKTIESERLTERQSEELASLYLAHAADIASFIERRSCSPALAADITSRTFEQAAKRLAHCEPGTLGCGWLMTVAKRRLVDHWRQQTARSAAERCLSAVLPAADEVPFVYRRSAIRESFESLTFDQRRALWLRHIDGYSVAEVAEKIGRTYRGTESLLGRSRIALRDAITQKNLG